MTALDRLLSSPDFAGFGPTGLEVLGRHEVSYVVSSQHAGFGLRREVRFPKVLDLYLTSGTATANRDRLQNVENPAFAGLSKVGGTGLEPVTSCLSSRRSA